MIPETVTNHPGHSGPVIPLTLPANSFLRPVMRPLTDEPSARLVGEVDGHFYRVLDSQNVFLVYPVKKECPTCLGEGTTFDNIERGFEECWFCAGEGHLIVYETTDPRPTGGERP